MNVRTCNCVLIAALAGAFHSFAATHNIAFRRAVYQSSAADYTHVGHLATDGKSSDTSILRMRSEFPDKSPVAEIPKMAFDGNKDTKWLVFESKCWLEVALPAPARATSYAIMSANDDSKRDPQKWRILASNDGATFEELASMEKQGFGKRRERKTWKIDKPGEYRFYRLAIDSNNGASETQLAEFDLLDDVGSSIIRNSTRNFQSRWISKSGADEWLKVDLGAPSRVDSVSVKWAKGGEAEASHVELSADGKTWTRGTSGKDLRFVKLVCEKAKGDVFGVDEIEVMGDNALKVAETGWRLAPARDVQATGEELSKGKYDDSAWLPAVVPGTVLTSYFKAGAIPDMNIADNQLAISDGFFYDDFWYRHEFTVPAERKGQRVWLNFDAINWKAEVYVNGTRVGDIKGGFIRGRFDVTKFVNYGGENRLAVKIIKNKTPGEVTVQDKNNPGPNGGVLGHDNPTIHASIGWDWVPTIRGRNIGIYRDVNVSYSGDVWLSDGWVVTDLDVGAISTNADGDGTPSLPKAEATVRVRAHNASDKPVKATLSAELSDGGKVSSEVELKAGETREVTVGTVTMEKPKLWWPATYGDQPLYGAAISAKVDGKASDAHSFKFGVRKFTYSEGTPLKIYCNGTRIVCRGGNWGMDDANLAATPFDYDTKVRLHAEANLTMIRNWVGMVNSDDFYKACDKYGVLVWDDFWLANPGDGPNPDDAGMFIRNAQDKVLKNRHHASIALYCGRNEGYPPWVITKDLEPNVKNLDGTRHYIPHSAKGTVSGFGPYNVMSPKWYFEKAPETLHSERGQPNVPEIESMRKMLGPDHLWPTDAVWGMHDYTADGAQSCKTFSTYIRNSYGNPRNLDEFTRFAQAVAYENHKAMFESVYSKGGNGLLMWMSQSAWPSMVWQTYDYWHDVNGGYYGSKVGNQSQNVILDQSTKKFWAVNATTKPLKATAKVAFYDTTGKELLVKASDVTLEADSKCELFDLPELAPDNGVLLIRATIANSENFTWINVKKERDYKALAPLLKGKAKIENVKVSAAKQGVTGEATVVNNTKAPLLLLRLRLADENGERVLPVHWSENYISLMPGESRVVKFEAPAAKGKVTVAQGATQIARACTLPVDRAAEITSAQALAVARTMLSKMTLEEKTQMCAGSGTMTIAGIPRLGVTEEWTMSDNSSTVRPQIERWGWNYTNPKTGNTKLPSLSALAQTWDVEWARRHGEVLGSECRERGVDQLLGPGVNIMRTPLCGRNWEYLGEDPVLTAKMCVPYIKGVQSYDVAATVKHFCINNQEMNRNKVDTHCDDRTLNEIYLPAFRAAVKEAGVLCVMSSYNKVDGIFASENKYTQHGILRDRWGFKGLLVSDWGGQHSTAFAAVNGTGVEMFNGSGIKYLCNPSKNQFPLAEAVKRGEVPAATVDDMALHTLYVMAKTGFLTGAERKAGERNTPDHQLAARQEGAESIVLLKNDKGILPLNAASLKKVLVIGSGADSKQCHKGCSAEGNVPYEVTLFAALKQRLPGAEVTLMSFPAKLKLEKTDDKDVAIAGGHAEQQQTEVAGSDAAKLRTAAEAADAVIVFTGTELGYQENMESECRDRREFNLPEPIQNAIHAILGWNMEKCVVVSRSGTPVGYTWTDKAPALLQSSYLGMEEGNSICDVIFGDVNPCGKLAQTWPKRYADTAVAQCGTYNANNVTYRERFYVGYRWHDAKNIEPLFPFGYGLSYTTFRYGKASVRMANDVCTVTIPVVNTGKVAGKEVVQLYVAYPDAKVERCVKELKAFAKVALRAGEKKDVELKFSVRDLAYWESFSHRFRTDAGRYELLVGSSSADIRAKAEMTLEKGTTFLD